MMKRIALLCLILTFLSAPAWGQAQSPKDADQFVAAGVSLNQYAAPQISGMLLYAKRLADTGTYSFSLVDVISKSVKPFNAATSITTGIAQKLFMVGPARVFAVTTIGTIVGGDEIGYSWTGGGAVAIPLGKGWNLMPSVRVLTSGVTSRQMIYGLAVGWGK